jgi:hypothetical protein
VAWLILRDIPKHEAQLDLVRFPVEGGFRGFQNVLPGYHFVRVTGDDGKPLSMELVVAGHGEARVLRPGDGVLVEDSGPGAGDLAATAPRMASALIDPLAKHGETALAWQIAAHALDRPASEVTLGTGSGLDAFLARHGGRPGDALRELAAAFARMAFLQEVAAGDRLAEILGAHYRAGERRVREHAAYFKRAAPTVSALFRAAPSLKRAPKLIADSDMLVEDLRDAGLAAESDELRTALA